MDGMANRGVGKRCVCVRVRCVARPRMNKKMEGGDDDGWSAEMAQSPWEPGGGACGMGGWRMGWWTADGR
jgi:hypothetical protein